MRDADSKPFALGLDLGVQSLGWAIIELDDHGDPCGVRRVGVRCFDSGVGSEADIAQGKDQSKNVERRGARLLRRQFSRRARRQAKVFHLLQRAGLLPAGEVTSGQQRHEIIARLDAALAAETIARGDRIGAHLLPYRLRALALDQPLPPLAFGRALYHLAQRRGFLSNRKSEPRKDEKDDESVVKEGIGKLQQEIEHSGARTLGEFFSRLDPEEQRIRSRYTARQMYVDEFENLWAAQSPHHTLDASLHDSLREAIFHQRPLKPQAGLIGMCDLEPNCRRAPWAALEAQRFRCLQKVNDLEIVTPENHVLQLSDEQRATLIEAMEHQGEMKFTTMRKLLGLKGPGKSGPGFAFNLEAGGETKLRGNVTRARIEAVIGDRFGCLPPEKQAGLVSDLVEYENREALERRLVCVYGLTEPQAVALADVTLEPGYCSLSLEALRKIVPLMSGGTRFATAREKIYGQHSGKARICEELPPVFEAKPQLRNPAVARGLTELRKVVNAIVRQYGKPEIVRIELARDLKRSRSQRDELSKQMRRNEAEREKARMEIETKAGIKNPSDLDVLKVRLAWECDWECPYTGKTISMKALVGSHSQFDVEHIIPFSRSLDNSFLNKTLCDAEENRNRKRNHTPFEAYAGDESRWREILARVRRFQVKDRNAKLRRFLQKEPDEDFAARQLNDTRYMSRLAAEYVGLLYGGQIDAAGRRRVQVSAGRATAFLRDQWGMNAILGDGDEKNRDDHRHHAVDAAAIALTEPRTVKLLSDSAQRASLIGWRLFTALDPPWSAFIDDLREAVGKVVVSYRINRRVSGPLHDQTYYSKVHPDVAPNGKKVEYRHFRKPLSSLSADRIENIVDPAIRAAVKAHLERHGGDLKKAFADPNNMPYLKAGDGRIIPIRKARIREPVGVLTLGKEPHQRYAAPGSNHHMEIVAETDAKGRQRWIGVLVNLFEAAQRVRQGLPVVCRDHGPNRRFLFSLAGREFVEMDGENGDRRIFRIKVISGDRVEFRLHTDARPDTLLRKEKGGRTGLSKTADALRKARARKVAVDPLGNVFPARD